MDIGMTNANWVNSLGLAFDIAGAVLLYRYGLPEQLSREGHQHLILNQIAEAEKAKARLYDRLGRIGLGLLIVGFGFQLLSNFL